MQANPLRDDRVTEDFIYENAPLVEVVTELRWALVPLASMQGAAVDPLFGRAATKFTEAVGELGYLHVERLVPAEVPIELCPYQPIFRCRLEANRWPLFQIGPGLFTCNITPPYNGWTAFRSVIKSGLEALEKTYGLGSVAIEPNLAQVRYINAFTAKHGMTNLVDFCAADLNLNVTLMPEIVAAPHEATFVLDYSFPAAETSTINIKCGHGQSNGIPAALLELAMSRQANLANTVEGTLAWMDQAHTSLRNTFQKMASPKLQEAMGPIKPVGRRQ
jgi:uncharacterized protein (TIGR04255 family)